MVGFGVPQRTQYPLIEEYALIGALILWFKVYSSINGVLGSLGLCLGKRCQALLFLPEVGGFFEGRGASNRGVFVEEFVFATTIRKPNFL